METISIKEVVEYYERSKFRKFRNYLRAISLYIPKKRIERMKALSDEYYTQSTGWTFLEFLQLPELPYNIKIKSLYSLLINKENEIFFNYYSISEFIECFLKILSFKNKDRENQQIYSAIFVEEFINRFISNYKEKYRELSKKIFPVLEYLLDIAKQDFKYIKIFKNLLHSLKNLFNPSLISTYPWIIEFDFYFDVLQNKKEYCKVSYQFLKNYQKDSLREFNLIDLYPDPFEFLDHIYYKYKETNKQQEFLEFLQDFLKEEKINFIPKFLLEKENLYRDEYISLFKHILQQNILFDYQNIEKSFKEIIKRYNPKLYLVITLFNKIFLPISLIQYKFFFNLKSISLEQKFNVFCLLSDRIKTTKRFYPEFTKYFLYNQRNLLSKKKIKLVLDYIKKTERYDEYEDFIRCFKNNTVILHVYNKKRKYKINKFFKKIFFNIVEEVLEESKYQDLRKITAIFINSKEEFKKLKDYDKFENYFSANYQSDSYFLYQFILKFFTFKARYSDDFLLFRQMKELYEKVFGKNELNDNHSPVLEIMQRQDFSIFFMHEDRVQHYQEINDQLELWNKNEIENTEKIIITNYLIGKLDKIEELISLKIYFLENKKKIILFDKKDFIKNIYEENIKKLRSFLNIIKFEKTYKRNSPFALLDEIINLKEDIYNSGIRSLFIVNNYDFIYHYDYLYKFISFIYNFEYLRRNKPQNQFFKTLYNEYNETIIAPEWKKIFILWKDIANNHEFYLTIEKYQDSFIKIISKNPVFKGIINPLIKNIPKKSILYDFFKNLNFQGLKQYYLSLTPPITVLDSLVIQKLKNLNFQENLDEIAKLWLDSVKKFLLFLESSYNNRNAFRKEAQSWKKEVEDMNPNMYNYLIKYIGGKITNSNGVSDGNADHWIDSKIPVEDKLLKIEENFEKDSIIFEVFNKSKKQLFREAKYGYGILIIADIRKSIKNNVEQNKALTDCFEFIHEENRWIAVFLIQAFTGTPSNQ